MEFPKHDFGKLEICENSPTSISVLWKVADFFSLPGGPGDGVTCRKFQFAGFDCYISLQPYLVKQVNRREKDYTRFWVVCLFPDHPDTKVECEMGLKTDDGSLYKSPLRHEEIYVTKFGTIYVCKYPRLEIVDMQEILLPGGVLSVICKLNFTGDAPILSSESESSIPNSTLAFDLKKLLISGKCSDVTIMVKGEEFRAHLALLGARVPLLAYRLKYEMARTKTNVVVIDDLCDASTFRAFLHYVYTGRIDTVSLEKASRLVMVAEKYHLDELKELCVECRKEVLSMKHT